jgi:hypothetical protein
VLRFRSSHHIAASSLANLGIDEHWQTHDSGAALNLKFRWPADGEPDRNFTAPGPRNRAAPDRFLSESHSLPFTIRRDQRAVADNLNGSLDENFAASL